MNAMEDLNELKVHILWKLVGSIVPFRGDGYQNLQQFIVKMDRTFAIIAKEDIPEDARKELLDCLITRVVPDVMATIGSSYESPWEETKLKLRERYLTNDVIPIKLTVSATRNLRRRDEPAPSFARNVLNMWNGIKAKCYRREPLATAAQLLTIYNAIILDFLRCQLTETMWNRMDPDSTRNVEDAAGFIMSKADDPDWIDSWSPTEFAARRQGEGPSMRRELILGGRFVRNRALRRNGEYVVIGARDVIPARPTPYNGRARAPG